MIIAGLPLGVLYISEVKAESTLLDKLSYYEREAERTKTAKAYVLTKDVYAGDEITEDLVKTVEYNTFDDISKIERTNVQSLVGSYAKIGMNAGTVLGADMVSSIALEPPDIRELEMILSELPESLDKNDFVDIRISFPDGEDFIVIPHKRVYSLINEESETIDRTGIVVKLSEEEILRYRSASVDAKTYNDTVIYAIPYCGDYQYTATDYYPVNDDVFSLLQWDPNINDLYVIEGENQRRKSLEDANYNYRN